MLVGKKVCLEKNFGQKKILVGKKILIGKNVGRKKFWSKKIFSQKNFLVGNVFWSEFLKKNLGRQNIKNKHFLFCFGPLSLGSKFEKDRTSIAELFNYMIF